MRTFVAIASALFLSACSQGTSQDNSTQPMNGGSTQATKDGCCSDKTAAKPAKDDGCCQEKAAANTAAKEGDCCSEKASVTQTEAKKDCCADRAPTECDKDKKGCDPQSKTGECPMTAAAAADKKDCCQEAVTIETSAGVPAQDAGSQQVVDRKFLKPGDTRTFAVEYVGKVGPVPAGTKRLRVWMPVPQDSTVQTIKNLSFSTQPKVGTESKYGNKIAYWEIANPGANVEITMKFECSRLEVLTDLAMLKSEGTDPADSYGVFRGPDKLVLVDDEIRKLSDEVCAGQKTSVDKARAIYEYVLKRMTYDKNHEGWGQGSTRHACDVGKGNCTDFHALFNSLCRAQGIASGFEIGLYLPYERKKDEKLGGYHCWALFRVPGRTWVPVDASEADRFPERADYFFGGHTSNRVTLSTGRDITLEPKQDGEPVNYILNPYAEADGKSVKTDKAWSYKDLD